VSGNIFLAVTAPATKWPDYTSSKDRSVRGRSVAAFWYLNGNIQGQMTSKYRKWIFGLNCTGKWSTTAECPFIVQLHCGLLWRL